MPFSAKQQREMTEIKFYGVRGYTTVKFDCLSELERHSYQQCSKIGQTHSTSLTGGNNCEFSSRELILSRDVVVVVVLAAA